MSQVNLTWAIPSGNPVGYVVERSIGNTSSFIALATSSVNEYQDITTILTGSLLTLLTTASYYYKVYSFTSAGTSSYSNIVRIPAGAMETWDEYSIGKSSSFDSGSGDWVGVWKLDDRNKEIARETFDNYTIGATGSFNGVFGWLSGWKLDNSIQMWISREVFDYYIVGDTGSFNSGSGWLAGWNIKSS